MSTTRKIAHNTASQITGKAVSTLLGLVALAMMTRYLGAEQFGWYITAISFLQFVAILVDFGLIPVTAQMLSEDNEQRTTNNEPLLHNLLGYRLVTSVVFLGIAPLIALFFPYPPLVKIAIAFTTINFLAVALNQIFVGYFQTKLQTHIYAIGEVIGRAVLVVGLWLAIRGGLGFLWIMGTLTISSLAFTAYLWINAKRETSIRFAFDKVVWKQITVKMWPIALAIIFNVVYLRGDVILLSLFRDQAEVGLYGAAYRVIDIFAQMAMMLMGIMLPLLSYHWSRMQKTEFLHRYQQSFDAMMALSIPIALGLIMLAEPIVVFVAGAEFAEAGRVLQVLALAVFGVYVGAVFGHASVAINKQKQVLPIYISAAILTLLGYLYAIPRFGMFGAAWMTVFSEIYVGTLLFLAVRHYTLQQLSIITTAKILFSGVIMASVLYQIRDAHVIIATLIGGVVYISFAFALGVVSKETVKEILGNSD